MSWIRLSTGLTRSRWYIEHDPRTHGSAVHRRTGGDWCAAGAGGDVAMSWFTAYLYTRPWIQGRFLNRLNRERIKWRTKHGYHGWW